VVAGVDVDFFLKTTTALGGEAQRAPLLLFYILYCFV
jgi:hypothetical protein